MMSTSLGVNFLFPRRSIVKGIGVSLSRHGCMERYIPYDCGKTDHDAVSLAALWSSCVVAIPSPIVIQNRATR